MSHVAANADIYAAQRINVFFPGVIPSLDGQCVSLVKWFMAEMSDVPNPQAPRGDARYVGKTLVAQGHASEVAYANRQRGDIICYENGTYGHIGVVLSGNRTFEENVNWSGVSSKIVDGARVYASRIGNLSETWRHDQHIYRLKTYNEGGNKVTDEQKLMSGPVLDVEFYRTKYPDLAKNGVNTDDKARSHWASTGVIEGRQSSRVFSVTEYIANYTDLQKLFTTPNSRKDAAIHWFDYGVHEGRKGVKSTTTQIVDRSKELASKIQDIINPFK